MPAHVNLASEYEGEVDLANDLIPLCANCHVMVHRRKTMTSIKELKALLEQAKS